jgi:ribokinase
MNKPRILVVGSMNMDLFVRDCNSIPGYGESIICGDYGYATGGKGSNQAFAVAKLGAEAVMVGRVGRDTNGDQLIESLRQVNVNTDYVIRDEETQTGLALMLVNNDGRYASYVSIGANYRVSVEDVRRALDAEKFDMLVMQLEIPLETVYATCELAKERNIPVFLDAGPAMHIPVDRLKGLYIFSPNEAETEALTGISVETNEGALEAAKWLYENASPEYVILKLGSRGALLYDGKEAKFIPCFKVNAIDSTAAGDTFGACLAIQLCKGKAMEEAIVIAHAAAGICVSRQGAQISIPTEEEVEQFLKERTGGSN